MRHSFRILQYCTDRTHAGRTAVIMMIALLWPSAAVTAAAAPPPHLIQLVIDDLGHADTSVHTHPAQPPDVPTPHLRAIADGGVRLSHYYVQPVCSPTRAALLTGRFPFRDGMQHERTIAPGSRAHLPLTTPTAAELLGGKGYSCHAIGKWHQGYASWKYTPLQRGFSTFTGYLQGQVDYWNKTLSIPPGRGLISGFDFWHGEGIDKRSKAFREAVGTYSLDLYRAALKDVLTPYAVAHAAVDTVVEDASREKLGPLYLYLAMQTVHIPLEARLAAGDMRCAAIKDHWRGIYCSMLVEMDDAVGELVSDLKAAGMWQNTLILTTTDNGGMTRWGVSDGDKDPAWPASVGDNYPLRGGKATLFQGGVNGIAFIGGGGIPTAVRGSTYDGLTHAVDLCATVLGRGGASTSTIDGIDLWPAITGATVVGGHQPAAGAPLAPLRTHLPVNLIHNGTDFSCVVFAGGDLKLIIGRTATLRANAINGWFRHGLYPPVEPPPSSEPSLLLFNLSSDPTERQPLPAATHASFMHEGQALLAQYLVGTDPQHLGYMEPQDNTPAFPRCLPALHGGAWAPFLRSEEVEDIGRGS